MPFPPETLKRIKYLEGEELFRQYCEMGKEGSIKKLVKWCNEQGKISPKTGKGPLPATVHSSMWRWALKYPEIAKPLYAKLCSEHGEFLDDGTWNGILKHFAKTKYRGTKAVKYLNKYPDVANAIEARIDPSLEKGGMEGYSEVTE